MATIDIKFCDIPIYLRAGYFYRQLAEDDKDGVIRVPADCFSLNGIASNLDEFCQLLRVHSFWHLDELPKDVLRFCSTNNVHTWRDADPGRDVNNVPILATCYCSRRGVPLKQIFQLDQWQLTKHALQRVSKSSNATALAAELGNLLLLKYLHKEEFVWHVDTCAAASKNGHRQCLKYAYKNGCPWDSNVMMSAARNGHLKCMRYAHERNCPWDYTTPQQAAMYGHVDSLRYALERGCPYGDDLLLVATNAGRFECVKYLVDDRAAPMDENVFLAALMSGKLQCVQYLLDQGCPFLDAKFSSVETELLYRMKISNDVDSEFYKCASLAIQRGWRIDANTYNCILSRDIKKLKLSQVEKWFVDAQYQRNRYMTAFKIVYCSCIDWIRQIDLHSSFGYLLLAVVAFHIIFGIALLSHEKSSVLSCYIIACFLIVYSICLLEQAYPNDLPIIKNIEFDTKPTGM